MKGETEVGGEEEGGDSEGGKKASSNAEKPSMDSSGAGMLLLLKNPLPSLYLYCAKESMPCKESFSNSLVMPWFCRAFMIGQGRSAEFIIVVGSVVTSGWRSFL